MAADTETEIEWRDPPRRGGSGTSADLWSVRLRPLMDRPGEWAMVRRFNVAATTATKASQLRNGRLSIPDGEWEFAARGVELFARYLGPFT